MSFQEVKTLEGELARVEKLYAREKDWSARAVLADEILAHCRRLSDLEKRAFVSNKFHSEEWIARFRQERDDCVYKPLEEQVAILGKLPFSAETYEGQKEAIQRLIAAIIAGQQSAHDSPRYGHLLERLWEVSVAADENFDSYRKLAR